MHSTALCSRKSTPLSCLSDRSCQLFCHFFQGKISKIRDSFSNNDSFTLPAPPDEPKINLFKSVLSIKFKSNYQINKILIARSMTYFLCHQHLCWVAHRDCFASNFVALSASSVVVTLCIPDSISKMACQI